ncbi:hypothetical protein AX17_002726 [Amanita inopinata Kibby_2008]|nr:hypothetical protein AX17_002726 [Amanita inopinata Kibby_2008]
MATNLYETLEISRDATLEDIRRAYKKKALQTHPDRLPQGASADDKKLSEEQFRLVNNAYEILSDSQKRKIYDKHGAWPPPEPEQDYVHRAGSYRGYSHRHHYPRASSFSDPFVSHGFSSFIFTDPFSLFDQIFANEFPDWHHRPSAFPGRSGFMHEDPFFGAFQDPFFHRMPMGMSGLFAGMERSMLGMPSPFQPQPISSRSFPTIESTHRGRRGRGSGQWTQESHITQMINGETQSVHKRVDAEGNEHITRTYPDGREVHTVNGVEQPVHGYLPSSGHKDTRHLASPSHPDSRQYSSGHAPQSINVMRSDFTSSPPPPYPGPGPSTYNTGPFRNSRHREHRHSERHSERPATQNRYDVDPNIEHKWHDDKQHRAKWWGGW